MTQDLPDSPDARAGRATAPWLDIAMVVANVLGVLLYLWRAHYSWMDPRERAAGVDSVTGEPFIWAMGVLPVWALYFVLNASWAVTMILRRPRRGALPFAVVLALWIVAFLVDRAHH